MTDGLDDSIEELLPAYALNALDEKERDLVERALEREPRYQSSLADHLAAAAALAPVQRSAAAPASVHERVMREVWAPPPAAVGMATRVRPRFPVALLGVAAAWIFAFVAVGTIEMLHSQRVRELEEEMDTLAAENQRQEQRLQQTAEVANFAVQPGVQQVSMAPVSEPEPPKSPPVGFVYTNTDGRQVLFAMNLEQPPAGSLYRVWLYEDTGETYPMATFTVDQGGQAYVPMWMSALHQGSIWITVHMEPEDAGDIPVGDRVLWGRLR